jgi:hypothetical protein
VSVAMLRVGGVAVDRFDSANLDVPDVAGDFGGVAVVPAVAVVAWFEYSGQSDPRVYLLRIGSSCAIFEAIQVPDHGIRGVAFEPAAIKSFEILPGRWPRARRVFRLIAPAKESEKSERENQGPYRAIWASHFSERVILALVSGRV